MTGNYIVTTTCFTHYVYLFSKGYLVKVTNSLTLCIQIYISIVTYEITYQDIYENTFYTDRYNHLPI